MSAWWERAAGAVRDDFSDLGDPASAVRVLVRLVVAAALGGVLGYEREYEGKSVGMRTHMLVALGAALFVVVPQQAGATAEAMTRVVQGLIAGIGFLGAGAIMRGPEGWQAKGLTTAAGIWATAAIGVTAGLGHEASAVVGTVLALVILWLLPHQFGGRPGPPQAPGGDSSKGGTL